MSEESMPPAHGSGPATPSSETQAGGMWHRVYEHLAKYRPGDLKLMNYGFLDLGNDGVAGDGGEAPTSEELSYALYRRVVGPAPIEGARVLECGCGRGGGSALIAQLGARAIWGLDFSSGAVFRCREAFGDQEFPGFLVGDAQFIPFAAGAFDAVCNVESSHCYPSRPEFFAEVERVLNDGGWFLFADMFQRGEEPDEVFADLGFEIQEREDITPGVIAACQSDEARRRELVSRMSSRSRKAFEAFYGVPGSPSYQRLVDGASVYLRYCLRKSA